MMAVRRRRLFRILSLVAVAAFCLLFNPVRGKTTYYDWRDLGDSLWYRKSLSRVEVEAILGPPDHIVRSDDHYHGWLVDDGSVWIGYDASWNVRAMAESDFPSRRQLGTFDKIRDWIRKKRRAWYGLPQ